MVLSELIHIITIGELVIPRPKPLKECKLQAIAPQNVRTLPSSRSAPFPVLGECLHWNELNGTLIELETYISWSRRCSQRQRT